MQNCKMKENVCITALALTTKLFSLKVSNFLLSGLSTSELGRKLHGEGRGSIVQIPYKFVEFICYSNTRVINPLQ